MFRITYIKGSKIVFFVTLFICSCINYERKKEDDSRLPSATEMRDLPLHSGLIINSDCHGELCNRKVQLIESSGNEFSMYCEYLNPQNMNIIIVGATGSNILNMTCYLVCWQAHEIDSSTRPYIKPKNVKGNDYFVYSFDNLNIGAYDYTVALRVGDFNKKNNYPIAVHIPAVSDGSSSRNPNTWGNTSRVSVTPINFTDDTFRCAYQIPNGNSPSLAENNYIVLFQGEMSAYFNEMAIKDFTSHKKVTSTGGGTKENMDLPLSKELLHGQVYTVAYLMGQAGDTLPNLNGLVAWNTFIAN